MHYTDIKTACFTIVILCLVQHFSVQGQDHHANRPNTTDTIYWNANKVLNPYRLPFNSGPVEYVDLDGDGDPDVLKTIVNGKPVQWIDDDDDMMKGDMEGDLDSDCLMIDRNGDGQYGHYGDVVVDWVDNDQDGDADIQVYADYAREDQKDATWGPGHLMINIDTDDDNIMNYIDWNNFHLRGWLHHGQSDFYEDYHGQSLFLKIHTSPEKMNDPHLNWENPFLFYDPDADGLTEYAIRICDTPVRGKKGDRFMTRLTGMADWVSMAFDLDNDNAPENEFDFDMTISFRGGGFDYTDQVHAYPQLRGLPESDRFFMDARVRQMDHLIYPDHGKAKELIFSANWDQVFFAYDEDDDCQRWERVELYDPLDPYITGKNNGGLDNNGQADALGDRGEWDLDNSGGGRLYVGSFDGRLHLYGAESGYWRVDQNAAYFQGMGGLYDGYGPERLSRPVQQLFPVVKYTDTNNNGFFDLVEYDLEGDGTTDESISLIQLGLDDTCQLINTQTMDYADFTSLQTELADAMWQSAMNTVKAAKNMGLETQWYTMLMNPKSTRQKYNMGYWLRFYLYHDMVSLASGKNDKVLVRNLMRAYYSGDWSILGEWGK